MTKTEAIAAANHAGVYQVKTKGGAIYEVVDPDNIDESDPDAIVLGYRVNKRASGPFRKASPSHRWLMIKNIEAIKNEN